MTEKDKLWIYDQCYALESSERGFFIALKRADARMPVSQSTGPGDNFIWNRGDIRQTLGQRLNGHKPCKEQTTKQHSKNGEKNMAFFTSAVGTLQTLVIALGAGLGI